MILERKMALVILFEILLVHVFKLRVSERRFVIESTMLCGLSNTGLILVKIITE